MGVVGGMAWHVTTNYIPESRRHAYPFSAADSIPCNNLPNTDNNKENRPKSIKYTENGHTAEFKLRLIMIQRQQQPSPVDGARKLKHHSTRNARTPKNAPKVPNYLHHDLRTAKCSL